MSDCTIIDTVGRFQQVWQEHAGEGASGQVHTWETEYMATYPELLAKLTEDVDMSIEEGRGLENWRSWRDVAAEKVFPFLAIQSQI